MEDVLQLRREAGGWHCKHASIDVERNESEVVVTGDLGTGVVGKRRCRKVQIGWVGQPDGSNLIGRLGPLRVGSPGGEESRWGCGLASMFTWQTRARAVRLDVSG